jgi:hypothetical protein
LLRASRKKIDLVSFQPAAPNYQLNPRLEQQLRQDDRSGVQQELQGSGTFVPGTPNVLTIQLQVADHITWWKKIEVSTSFFGFWFWIRTLGTVNDSRVASVDLTTADAQSGVIKLDFWKAGFLNSGSYVTTMVLDVASHLGSKVVFLCSRDHPSQP